MGKQNENNQHLIEQIKIWKKKRNALIIAHNYQIPDIQDIADYVGDSLDFPTSSSGKRKSHDLLRCPFYGRKRCDFFPGKNSINPDLKAGCSLADSIDAEELRKWKRRYPKAVVVSYVNTTAEVKAESDYCCTSSNAVRIVNAIQLIRNYFCSRYVFGRLCSTYDWQKNLCLSGECHVHARASSKDIRKKLGEHPAAEFLIHPECGCTSDCMHYIATKKFRKQPFFLQAVC